VVNGRQETFLGSGLGVTQRLFDLRPHRFDGIEIGTIGRKEAQLCACGLNKFLGFGVSVGRKIIADDDVSGLERGTKKVADVFTKDDGVGGPLDDHASGLTAEADRPQHSGGLPMATGSMVMEPLSMQCTTAQSGHVGLGAGLVQKDQSICQELFLLLFPEASFLNDIRTILFAGPQRFF
jgi:hypothetical protein